jgi:hypothetical protein
VQYQYRHIPLPVLAFNNGACTGTGIAALWFSTGIGTVHYRNWHSKMVPVPILSFLHFGSVPVKVKAKSITGTYIQLWCPYQYWHYGTLIQYQYWHGTLLVLALKNTVPKREFACFGLVPTTIPLLEDYNNKITNCNLILNCKLSLSNNYPTQTHHELFAPMIVLPFGIVTVSGRGSGRGTDSV